MLGIYGIAKALTDMISVFVVRLGDFVIFPTIAASKLGRKDLRMKLGRVRPRFLMIAVIAIAGFSSFSDILVDWLYDERYGLAALMLPVMAVATWFGILSTMSEAILLGVGRPSYAAATNGLKLMCLLIAVPTMLAAYGLAGAIIAFAVAELARYLALSWAQWREGLSFFAQDAILTTALIVLAVILFSGGGDVGFLKCMDGRIFLRVAIAALLPPLLCCGRNFRR
jgi:O-antigen/teichoic acid export membrane protein